MDSLKPCRMLEFSANKQIHWADSESQSKLKQGVISLANQLRSVERLERLLLSASLQIHWADSESQSKLKQGVISLANQLRSVKRLERQLLSASLINNQLLEDLGEPLDRAQAKHLGSVFSNPRHKGGCSEDIQHSENQLKQVFLEHLPHKWISLYFSVCLR